MKGSREKSAETFSSTKKKGNVRRTMKSKSGMRKASYKITTLGGAKKKKRVIATGCQHLGYRGRPNFEKVRRHRSQRKKGTARLNLRGRNSARTVWLQQFNGSESLRVKLKEQKSEQQLGRPSSFRN